MSQQQQYAPSWYSIRNESGADGSPTAEAEIRIYDGIGCYGVTAQQFVDDLASITAPRLNLHINSPGGDVFDGTAILNALKAHPAKVVVHIDGIAASIASVIAMAGDEIRIAKNAYVMIHDPYGGTAGGAADLRKMADLLDKVRENIAETYAARAGGRRSKQQFLDMMAETTWFTAAEARDAGLADAVTDDEAQGVLNTLALPVFAKAPAEALRLLTNKIDKDLPVVGPSAAGPTPLTAPVKNDGPKETAMSKQIAPAKGNAIRAELPAPTEGETQETFLARCMGADGATQEACQLQWDASQQEPSEPASRASAAGGGGGGNDRPATISELKSAFAKDPGFALECAERAYTLTEARAAYATVLEARLANKDKELAEAKKAPPAAPAGNRPLGGNAAHRNNTAAAATTTAGACGDGPVGEFNARVADAMKVQNLGRRQAVLAVAKADPALHRDYLLATNVGRKQQELIKDRFDN